MSTSQGFKVNVPSLREFLPLLQRNKIETLDDDDDEPISFRKNNLLYVDINGNIYNNTKSHLGKRKLNEAFGDSTHLGGNHDIERYGQEILPDFFKNNIGHGVYNR